MKKFLVLALICVTVILAGCRTKTADPVTITNTPTPPSTTTNMQLTPKSGDTVAVLHTTMGDVSILLYANEVPETVKNFTELAKSGKYDNVIFHRVIPEFMIQTGDFQNGDGTGGYSYQGPGTYLNDEVKPGLEHIRGALSMAKTAQPNTAGSQFFIVQPEGGTHWLDGVHTVFGFVYEGMDVVDAIDGVATNGNDLPLETISITSVDVLSF